MQIKNIYGVKFTAKTMIGLFGWKHFVRNTIYLNSISYIKFCRIYHCCSFFRPLSRLVAVLLRYILFLMCLEVEADMEVVFKELLAVNSIVKQVASETLFKLLH